MRIQLADIAPFRIERIDGTLTRVPCDGAVFREDYARCTNRAVQRRGRWRLCSPHGRKEELEVVCDEPVASD